LTEEIGILVGVLREGMGQQQTNCKWRKLQKPLSLPSPMRTQYSVHLSTLHGTIRSHLDGSVDIGTVTASFPSVSPPSPTEREKEKM
jgi:hypothetical protein